jgi:hypothetical protein
MMRLFEHNEELKDYCMALPAKIEDEYGVTVLLLGISGSHMWGLDRPDSDVDIRGIYIKPLKQVLSLTPGRDTIEATLHDRYDIQLYEIGKALTMLNNNNGNLVELILSPTIFYHPLDIMFDKIAMQYVTKELFYYYRGYYESQRKRASLNRGGKALLYTYREIMQGIYLMRTGKIINNFVQLKHQYKTTIGDYPELVDKYSDRSLWGRYLDDVELLQVKHDWDILSQMLEMERNESKLPEKYDGTAELIELLYSTRMRYWGL